MWILILILSCLWIERAGCVPRSYIVWSGRETDYQIPFGESRSERPKATETRRKYRLDDSSGYFSNQRLPISYLLPRFPTYNRYSNFRLQMDAAPFMAYQPKKITSWYEPSRSGFEASSYDRKYDWDGMKYAPRFFNYEDGINWYSEYKSQKRNKDKYADIDSIPLSIHVYDMK